MEESSSSSVALVPQSEKQVDFYGDQIPAAQVDGEIYVPLRPLTDFLGLDRTAQQRRVQRDRVMSVRARQVRITLPDGRKFALLCLPLDLLPGWLFGITTGKMAAELADKLDRYRAECFRVLWNAFKGDIVATAAAPATDLTPAEQILQQVEAMYKLAQQQVELERQYRVMADYMRGHVKQTNSRLGDHEQRLVSIELRLNPESDITDEQASELALAVKNVAYAMEEHGISGGYGKVYSELYRRFRISSYKNLKRVRYDEAIAWLSERYEAITMHGGSVDNA